MIEYMGSSALNNCLRINFNTWRSNRLIPIFQPHEQCGARSVVGHHVCFTRKRSQVRALASAVFSRPRARAFLLFLTTYARGWHQTRLDQTRAFLGPRCMVVREWCANGASVVLWSAQDLGRLQPFAVLFEVSELGRTKQLSHRTLCVSLPSNAPFQRSKLHSVRVFACHSVF